MSADNGIYVLETAGPEYRVAELQAIENLHLNPATCDWTNDPKILKLNAEEMFGRAKLFTSRDEALDFAWDLAEQILENYGILEYGVSEINLDTIDLR